MAYTGGDPAVLDGAAVGLGHAVVDLAGDATAVAGIGPMAAGAAPGSVGQLAEEALAAVGGVLAGVATLAEALAQSVTVASDQLVRAMGGGR